MTIYKCIKERLEYKRNTLGWLNQQKILCDEAPKDDPAYDVINASRFEGHALSIQNEILFLEELLYKFEANDENKNNS